jgi:hypothetical protein
LVRMFEFTFGHESAGSRFNLKRRIQNGERNEERRGQDIGTTLGSRHG